MDQVFHHKDPIHHKVNIHLNKDPILHNKDHIHLNLGNILHNKDHIHLSKVTHLMVLIHLNKVLTHLMELIHHKEDGDHIMQCLMDHNKHKDMALNKVCTLLLMLNNLLKDIHLKVVFHHNKEDIDLHRNLLMNIL